MGNFAKICSIQKIYLSEDVKKVLKGNTNSCVNTYIDSAVVRNRLRGKSPNTSLACHLLVLADFRPRRLAGPPQYDFWNGNGKAMKKTLLKILIPLARSQRLVFLAVFFIQFLYIQN
jgi:hypothetical protein